MNYSGNNLYNKKTTVHFQLSFKGFCYRIALLLKIGSGGINSNPLSKSFMSKESSEYQNYDIPVITKRDLQNKLQRKFKRSNDLNNGLKELEERGYVRIFREGKSVKIKINPESFRD